MTTPLQSLSAHASNVSAPAISTAAATSAGNTYTDLNGLAALKNAPSSPQTIRAVSEQVEALFLQMMLKSMRDANAAGGELDSNETGMYQDMFDKQVALTLSKRQDLGIARLFERQLGGGKAPDGKTQGLKNLGVAPAAAAPSSQLKAKGASPDSRDGAAPPPTGANLSEQAADFVQQVLPTIRRAAAAVGVNPLGMLAQAALE